MSVVATLLCAVGAHPAAAQCAAGYVGLQTVARQDSVAVLFVGVASDVKRVGSAQVVTFTAERTWKGPVSQRMMIYRPIPVLPIQPSPPPGAPFTMVEFHPTQFLQGDRYVVIAHRLSDAERTQLGVNDQPVAFGTNICGDGSRLLSIQEGPELAKLGPGRAPIEQEELPRRIRVAPPIKIVDVQPDRSKMAGDIRTVVLSITIDAAGNVSRADVVQSIPEFDRTAIDCVLKWKYLPALINGVPRSMTTTVMVAFGAPR